MSGQYTLNGSFTCEGIGIHTGAESRVTVSPAPSGAGIVLYTRAGVGIPALATNVVDTSRCTILGKDGVTISTIEHLLSAFAGLGIIDAKVEVDGPELPIGDGSANIWVDAIRSVGVTTTGPASPRKLTAPIVVSGKKRVVHYRLPV